MGEAESAGDSGPRFPRLSRKAARFFAILEEFLDRHDIEWALAEAGELIPLEEVLAEFGR